MRYFKLNPNITSKKWKGILNLGELRYKNKELDEVELAEQKQEIILTPLHYEVLVAGEISPVNTIGADFLVFDEAIPRLETLHTYGVQYVPLLNKELKHRYILMHVFNHIDCVDWTLSAYEPWPKEKEVKDWQNPRGKFFFKPVLIQEKIPGQLHVFRLKEWGGAFNIIVSEEFKQAVLSLSFDHSFLEFHPLSVH